MKDPDAEAGRTDPLSSPPQTFTGLRFEQDFYLDQAILRRIQRAKQAQERHEVDDDDDDEDGEVDDRSLVQGASRTLGRLKHEVR